MTSGMLTTIFCCLFFEQPKSNRRVANMHTHRMSKLINGVACAMKETSEQRKKLHFDPTINAGHLLTFLGMLAALLIGWSTMDKRVLVLEEAKAYQRERDNSQDAAIRDKLAEIREGQMETRRTLEEIRKEIRK